MKQNSYIPNPRYILSLRESGYNNYQAIEDIIDNSVDALKNTENAFIIITATNLDTDTFLTDGKIIIADNGCGMTAETLHESLRLGSETNKSKDNDDLGRFGTGLKASALSIGKVFKIITKHMDDDYLTAIYDINIGILNNTWEFPIIRKSTEEEIVLFKSYSINESGTYLEISQLDGLTNKNTTTFASTLIKRVGEVYRYKISRRKNDGNISFYINSKLVDPIDPMCRMFKDTMLLNNGGTNKYEINIDGNNIEFYMDFYHISDEAKDVKRKNGTNPIEPNERNQGLYVIRNNRQIMKATTFDLYTKDNHANNFRAELRYDSKYDEYFRIDVKKIVIHPIQAILNKIEQDVNYYKNQSAMINKKDKKEDKTKLDEINDLMKSEVDKNPFYPKPTKTIFEDLPEKKEKKTLNNETSTSKNIDNKEKIISTKYPYKWMTYDGDERSKFFKYKMIGIKQYEIMLNRNHIFYERYMSLPEESKRLICNLIYTLIISQDDTLYDMISQIKEYDGDLDYDDKRNFINKFNEYWSDTLKDAL
jgi:hypothetical protein